MYVAIDYDRTLVEDAPYDAVAVPRLVPGARDALLALKAAGHRLLLWSARANRALLFNPRLDPFVRARTRRVNEELWEKERAVHLERYRQMVAHVERELPGVFDAIDDGSKPLVDLIVDDKSALGGGGFDYERWSQIARRYGAQPNTPLAARR